MATGTGWQVEIGPHPQRPSSSDSINRHTRMWLDNSIRRHRGPYHDVAYAYARATRWQSIPFSGARPTLHTTGPLHTSCTRFKHHVTGPLRQWAKCSVCFKVAELQPHTCEMGHIVRSGDHHPISVGWLYTHDDCPTRTPQWSNFS